MFSSSPHARFPLNKAYRSIAWSDADSFTGDQAAGVSRVWFSLAQGRLAERLEIHYTPKHGSWLNIAEIELSVLKRQCLARRIASIETMRAKVMAWNNARDNRQTKVDWQFMTKDARTKLKRLYPKL